MPHPMELILATQTIPARFENGEGGLEANLTQDIIVKDYPGLSDIS